MAELHKAWVLAAAAAGLVRFEDAKIKVNDLPNPGDKHEEPFKVAIFEITTALRASELFELAEADKGTIKVEVDGKETEVPADNPVGVLLGYAYGLNCRAKVRADFAKQFEDPDKAIKSIAEKLVKSGRFKSFDKALAAAKMLREIEDTE